MRNLAIPVIAVLLSATLCAAQTAVPPQQLEEWYRDVHHAAELYVSGDTAAAIALLNKRQAPPNQQRQLVQVAFETVELGQRTPKYLPIWTPPLVRALAALHMEAAIEAYIADDTNSVLGHVAVAELLFRPPYDKRPDSSPEWERVIGLGAAFDSRLAWAVEFLDGACGRYPDDATLLLACGSVHEAVAMLPADAFAPAAPPPAPRPDAVNSGWTAPSSLYPNLPSGATGGAGSFMKPANAARATHERHLQAAAKFLERALRTDPSNVQASIRLAHVRAMRGDDKGAIPLLEKVLSATNVPASDGYLAGLLLGTIHLRAKQFDRAEAVLKDASERVPGAPAARIALAFALHERGNAAESAAILDRAMQPSDSMDPWWGYRFGQYWDIEPTLARLKREARQ